MDDRSNTIAGWVLAGGIAALGLSILSGNYFHADSPERPETMGYAIEGVVSSDGAAEQGPPLATLLASADLVAGEAQFKKCIACHTVVPGGANGIGPNLFANMGKPHAHVAGFAYSDALSSVPGNWTWEAMDDWIRSPRQYAPGTKMTFAGIGNAQDRANLLAWLNSKGSNLPLPPPPTPEAEAPAEGEEGATAADTVTPEDEAPFEGGEDVETGGPLVPQG